MVTYRILSVKVDIIPTNVMTMIIMIAFSIMVGRMPALASSDTRSCHGHHHSVVWHQHHHQHQQQNYIILIIITVTRSAHPATFMESPPSRVFILGP